jgi:hypothetical protein
VTLISDRSTLERMVATYTLDPSGLGQIIAVAARVALNARAGGFTADNVAGLRLCTRVIHAAEGLLLRGGTDEDITTDPELMAALGEVAGLAILEASRQMSPGAT